jgi:hypothetical protein
VFESRLDETRGHATSEAQVPDLRRQEGIDRRRRGT